MQHPNGVAVVATQLADTDRRALSQAWYSALHLAERPPGARHAPLASAPPPANADGARRARNPHDAPPRRSIESARGAGDAARNAAARPAGEIAGPERRAVKTELARRIERRLALRPPRGATASFAVHGAGGRVHVVVRSDGGRTRVVAVCAAPLRERVERALAHARFALAGRGVRAEAA
ncbi:MAG TPA: hypothetical protein VGU66_21655 [Candidatus Elarobacter sp.]|nr:hypothetical protein [Candidatus Elarobacter sp.]